MIEIVLATCLADNANICKEVRIGFEFEVPSITQCHAMSMPRLAQWYGDNDGRWSIKRWHCAGHSQLAKN